MSSQVNITPLCPDGNSYFCFLLEIDSSKILIDCGSTEYFDFSPYHKYSTVLRSLDAILLSHADLRYTGALPYLMETLKVSCSAYSTVPVHNFSLVSHRDAFKSLTADGLQPPGISTQQIESAHEKITRLRYSQSVGLTGPAKGITITPFPCGNSVGASLWRIRKGNDDIIYAVDFNHKKERHLDGLNFELVQKPSLLLTNSSSIFSVHKNKKQRDADFIEVTLGTLRSGGNVLIPCKTATRALEIALLLEQTWNAERYVYPVYFLTNESTRTIEYAKSMLEWMGEGVIKAFGVNRGNPFDFQHIRLCDRLDVIKNDQSPKVVLASPDSIDFGFSRELFIEYAGLPGNAVLFITNKERFDWIRKQNCRLTFSIKRKVFLEGEELAEFLRQKAYLEERKRADAAFAALLKKKRENNELMWDEDEGDSDEEINNEQIVNLDMKDSAISDGKYARNIEDNENQISARIEGESSASLLLNATLPLLSISKSAISSTIGVPIEDGPSSIEVAERARERLKQIYWSDYRYDYFFKREEISSQKDPLRPLTAPIFSVFPTKEKRIKFDEYGEMIQPEDFVPTLPTKDETKNDSIFPLNTGSTYSSSASTATAFQSAKLKPNQDQQSTENDPEESANFPFKWTTEKVDVTIRCKMIFIDFEGLSDGRSIKTIISRISPRKLVIAGGPSTQNITTTTSEYMLHFCKVSDEITNDVIIAPPLISTNVSSSLDIFCAKIDQELLQCLSVKTYGPYELAYLVGSLSIINDAKIISPISAATTDDLIQNSPTPNINNSNNSSPTGISSSTASLRVSRHEPVLIGTAKLLELKKALIERGIAVELSAGRLTCGRITLKKESGGKLELEGVLCPEYYLVRDVLYSQLILL